MTARPAERRNGRTISGWKHATPGDTDRCKGGCVVVLITSSCHGSGYLVCHCGSGLGGRPEKLHLKLHLRQCRVKAETETDQIFFICVCIYIY